MTETMLWAPIAWLSGNWQQAVLLEAGADGLWSHVTTGVSEPPPQVQRLAGPALPGLVNAHSHAFQRAFAGLAERREGEVDDFWGWREQLYRVAGRLEPPQLQAIAAQLYIELLRVGYTHVCEFHYLQHRRDGSLYQDPLEMSWALALAAAETGMQLTLLPVLYELAGHFTGPIHIHVAEQAREVEQCIGALGARPIEWLARQGGGLDSRWHLVHATHASPAEIELVASSGAGVVLCPTTEANLGDGIADLPAWLATAVPISIGSDSQVTRAWREELRWLEYGQRLVKQQRNVAAAPALGQPSTAARLFERVLQGGASAAGFARWGFQVGARADLLVVDRTDSSLLGVPDSLLLDALVFSSPGRQLRDVMVAGRWQIKDHEHLHAMQVATRFEHAMVQLWREPPH